MIDVVYGKFFDHNQCDHLFRPSQDLPIEWKSLVFSASHNGAMGDQAKHLCIWDVPSFHPCHQSPIGPFSKQHSSKKEVGIRSDSCRDCYKLEWQPLSSKWSSMSCSVRRSPLVSPMSSLCSWPLPLPPPDNYSNKLRRRRIISRCLKW